MLSEQIPNSLLEFLGELLPRQSKAKTEAHMAACLAEDSTYDVVDSIRFEARDSHKHAFSYVHFEENSKGKIEVAFGTPRSDGGCTWTTDVAMLQALVDQSNLGQEEIQEYLDKAAGYPQS